METQLKLLKLKEAVALFVESLEGYQKTLPKESITKEVLQAIVDSDMYITMKQNANITI